MPFIATFMLINSQITMLLKAICKENILKYLKQNIKNYTSMFNLTKYKVWVVKPKNYKLKKLPTNIFESVFQTN